MNPGHRGNERFFEIFLVMTVLGLGAILFSIEQSQVVVLNLFFLPVVLAGFFLGRYRAGVLSLLSVVVATLVITLDLYRFSFDYSPLTIGLSVLVWGAVLGLTAIMVGTLNEDRNARAFELHEAHVGVVEVLSRYLQSANPDLHSRSERVDRLAEQVAIRMRLSPREVDDVRVAALLMDLSNIEITSRVIKQAVGGLEDLGETSESTFHGTELVKSLGSALNGAFPLVLLQTSNLEKSDTGNVPIGARILRITRRFVELTQQNLSSVTVTPEEAIDEIRQDCESSHDVAVVNTLEEITTTVSLDSSLYEMVVFQPAEASSPV
ncbi:hypothetical protein KOR42_18240 [Thalassoglobus neptunius]|uniref:Uncharacterized protein n=1 Tax=Thalassoglobus neptunius TaxID=1938619 RepID=A0A5C5X717_9PLAN|nr:HD domain-containing phosphohydrolase [Thalassoglobus neptunius]TWT58449.1 hypothetical protein KOR42_18240 [Thalassoglobus neptunius]